MARAPKGLIEETKAIIRLYFFLRYDYGLKEADGLNARELKGLLKCLKTKEKG